MPKSNQPYENEKTPARPPRSLQPASPVCNFWAVSQAGSARNAVQCRRFTRSEKPAANDPPAENRTEAQDPRRNRRPFPAKPPRTRGGAPAGDAVAIVSADTGATRGIAANTPPSPVHLGQRARGILLQDAQARAVKCKSRKTREEAKQDVFKYIELYHNTRRMHSPIGNNALCDLERDVA